MENNVIANVSQHSRDSGRTPVHILAARLEKERLDLSEEKRRIDQELTLLNADKNLALAKRGYGAGRNTSENCTRVSAEFGHRRAELVKRKQDIEERLCRIKATVAEKQLHKKNAYPDVVILERIEGLLIRLCEKLGA
jgi:hypothetical protein